MQRINMGMRDELKIPLTMLSISFLDKLPYKGSYKGKRFLFEKNKSDGDTVVKLKVYVWKDLYNFENTSPDEMVSKEFEYSKDGIDQGITFVEETNT